MRILLCAIALLGLIVAGCERGPPRYHVSGKVTIGGQPVPDGMIFFDPDISKGHDGRAGMAFIKKGQYDTRQDGEPTVGGPHQVRIHAFDGKPGVELPMGNMMAPEYTTPVELPTEHTTKDFNIPRGGSAARQ
jgi:hypothetical protein